MTFLDKIKNKWNGQKFVCIGLDQANFEINKSIIDTTYDLVCAYKPNSAFYECQGLNGRKYLEKTVKYLKQNHPDIPIILDAKRGDVENTNKSYAKDAFENLEVDALTINPYPGKQALQPFLDYKDKGIFVWVKSSNPGSGEFQNLLVEESKQPLYQIIAKHVAQSWNTFGNCAIVVGATYPDELKIVREIVGDLPILIPGIGSQGGDIAGLKNGLNKNNTGIIVSSSRAIIFADNPRETTLNLHQKILEALCLI